MTGLVVAAGFIGMVLAPCAVGIYSKWGEFAEITSDRPEVAEIPSAEAKAVPSPAIVLTPQPINRAPLSSLREAAERAASDVRNAETAAATAQAAYMVELSRTASRRAEAAAHLAQAAEIELQRATRALQLADANSLRSRQRENTADRDYLPHDHPSLDFPRSRVAPHRAA